MQKRKFVSMAQYRQRFEAVLARLARGGEPTEPRAPENAEKYKGHLPESIFHLWNKVGLGVFWDGYFQLCEPDKYRPVLRQAFGNDPDLDPDKTYPIGFSAFGEILAWNEDHRDVRIALVDSFVSCRWLLAPKQNIDPNITLLTSLLLADGASQDPLDENGRPLFPSVRSRLGILERGQIYGFKPILALGGNRTADSLTVYDALPHMSILAQATQLKLMDLKQYPPKLVRMIG